VQQIHHIQNGIRHWVVDHDVSVEISHHVTRRRRRQVSVKPRRHRTKIAAIAEWNESPDRENGPAPSVDIAEISPVVAAHAIAIAGPPRVRRRRSAWASRARSRRSVARATWIGARAGHRLNRWLAGASGPSASWSPRIW